MSKMWSQFKLNEGTNYNVAMIKTKQENKLN